ncbi:putative fatty acyl-CoA reductase CG5065 [Halyomorpha halys]|uniref:putative fatty acyl-CoA reductase CG5065 n=1 Tax=Halyomorpha halys TaxID=286706 RepID=UPI0006D5116B|nr:putative fatty acyl-CoA reductase CG5065 [Halyomorpha halys]
MDPETWKDKQNIMSIPEYFAGQSIFVTGGTGLMGKVFIEKILRSCPDVNRVYVLIRPKKGVPTEERWSKLIQLPLFEKLRSEKPEAFKKVVLIPGNINEEDMGISDEHRKLLQENVTIIYHVAALIQFTDSIRDALIQNTRGTLGMLELGKTIKNLKVFVHVSTAYCNFNMDCSTVTEKIHPACQDWKVMMRLLKTEPNTLDPLREKLLCEHPNPYTWSKSFGEQMVNEYRQFFPVIILRPGIVSATDYDPIPAWSDGTNACFSISSLIGLGVLRVFKGALDDNQDLIPVDTAIKAFLIAPWKLHVNGPQTTTDVYTCTTASEEVITYEEMESVIPQFLREFPSKRILWPPNCYHVPNPFLHTILFFFLQLIPGLILDLLFILCRQKPQFTSMNKKLINGYRVSKNIIANKVVFPNPRFKELPKYLKEEDHKDFGFTINYRGEEKQRFLMRQVIAFFKYYMKEDMCEENIKKNRERFERIKRIHSIIQNIGGFVVTWYLMSLALWIILIGQDSFPSIFN